MRISFRKLRIKLAELEMTKGDLRRISTISSSSLAKVMKDENVSIEVLKKICKALKCNIGDIMDILPDKKIKQSTNNMKSTIKL